MKNKTTKKKVTLERIADSITKLDIKIDEKIDELAMATAKGFKDVEERLSNKIDGVGTNFNFKINSVEKTLNKKIDGLDSKIDDLNFHKVRDEVFFLTQRVVKVERKV